MKDVTVRPWMLLLVLAANAALLAGYHLYAGSTGIKVATVALDEVILAARNQYARALMDPEGKARPKTEAEDDVRRTFERIDQAVAGVQRECSCILLARGAVLPGKAIPDYTQAVIAAIGAGQS